MAHEHGNPGVQILTCEVAELGPWWTKHRFSAPYWRVYWNAATGAELHWRGRVIALRPDRMVLIPPDTDFAASCRGLPTQLYIHFTAGSPFDRALPGLHTIRATGQTGQLAGRLHDADDATREGQWGALASLALVHTALCDVPPDALRPPERDPRIAAVLAAMDANLQHPLSNAQLAAIAGLSTNAFVRLFHETAGMPPQKLYTRKRIDQTCMRLHFTDLSMEQIAQEAGFCDRYHFSRAFRQLRGISPGAFRRQTGRSLR